MKNKGIILFLLTLAAVIIGVMLLDWFSGRPENSKPNKFEFSVDEFREVPASMIFYTETKNFKPVSSITKGISLMDSLIYLVGDRRCVAISRHGQVVYQKDLSGDPVAVKTADNEVYILYKNKFDVCSRDLSESETMEWGDENSYFTDLVVSDKGLFLADAGHRKVYRFDQKGRLLNEIDGKSGEESGHGFIVPSPYFDMEINPYGDLWVVNPGKHRMENYTPEGNLREHWTASGIQIENFSGCCNPAHFCFLPDGSFVTSEKGLVRIKIYKPSGEFYGVVAPPSKFDEKVEGQAPVVDTDEEGNIYALDMDRNVVRVFELKERVEKK